ncbi:MAG TPA: sensor histidine kinase [Cytophagaceae bacterium]
MTSYFLTNRIYNLLVVTGLLVLLLISNPAKAGDVVILPGPGIKYQPKSEVGYLWDGDKKINPEDVSTIPENGFEYYGDNVVSFGVRNEDLWVRVKFKNLHPEELDEYVLELAYPHYDTIEFIYKGKNNQWERVVTGDCMSFSSRKLFNKHFTLPLKFSDTTTQTVFFKISGEGSRQFPLFVQDRDTFHAEQERITLIYGGLFYGVILIMLIYNLFIFFSLKDKIYLYYVLFNFSVLIFYLGYSGYGFQYIWSEFPVINSRIIPCGVLLTALTCSVFARNFLETRHFTPVIDKVLFGSILMYAFILLLLPFLSYESALKLSSPMSFISALVILITSYRAWYKGNHSARFMAIAFSIYFIGIMLLTSNILGLLNRNFIVAHSMEIGTVVEITLLSLALSDKYSKLRIKTEKAQSKLIRFQRRINAELERKVEERTLQINQQKQELEESNIVKDKLLSIISHDLKGPLYTFQKLVAMMTMDEPTKENVVRYSLHLNNKLSGMISLVENILHWVRSSMKGINPEIEEIILIDIVKENVTLFSSQAALKNIQIVNEIPADISVAADKNIINLVIRNLISNAIKFTEDDGSITISAKVCEGEVLTEIRDTGIGMSQETILKLFNPDQIYTTVSTDKRSGTGLGLLLCKEFLGKISGRIWVESEPGKGSVFKFVLPLPKPESKE